ncbi:MAG: hypothetical protein RLY71_1197 [Pseudomonadota bacterium]|jgi:predicted Zn finger-like uncharacterized protein
MSLATACPSCSTVFRVVQDQLKASEGWVRCGHCHKVFNAVEHLFDLESRRTFSAPAAPRRPIGTATSVDMNDPAWQETAPAAFSNESLLRQARANRPITPPGGAAVSRNNPPTARPAAPRPVPVPPAPAPVSAPAPITPPVPPASTNLVELDHVDSMFPSTAVFALDEYTDPLMHEVPGRAEPPVQPPAPTPTPMTALPENQPAPVGLPGFMREADRRARWQRPWVRAGLGGLSLLLLGGLGAQVGYQMRDRIAARWPQTLPVLQTACQHLACKIEAPRLIEAIVVDNTALTRPPGVDGYRLSVVLRNRASHIVAAPHLELNLTDTTGAVVVRKVFSPADFQVHQAELAAQSDTTWSLAFQAPGQTIAGYTLSAFYP